MVLLTASVAEPVEGVAIESAAQAAGPVTHKITSVVTRSRRRTMQGITSWKEGVFNTL